MRTTRFLPPPTRSTSTISMPSELPTRSQIARAFSITDSFAMRDTVLTNEDADQQKARPIKKWAFAHLRYSTPDVIIHASEPKVYSPATEINHEGPVQSPAASVMGGRSTGGTACGSIT